MIDEPNTATPADLDSVVGQVADEFLERQARGERPDPEEYAARYPKAASLIRNVLQTLRLVESAGGPSNSLPHWQPDQVVAGMLGDFRLIREVGSGGMGVVYEAEQVSLCRRVALKVLPFAAMMDPRQLQRFRHEAQAAAMLHHPNIVPVHGVGCERSVHFYAMQLIAGRSLAAVIDEQRPECPASREQQRPELAQPPVAPAHDSPTSPIAAVTTQRTRKDKGHYRGIAELVAQAADALEYAHQQGVIHRDIKPANLLLDNAGHLWVTDFGLARLGDGTGLTASGDLLGTLRYMSPEQALAKHGMVDHRTDVYSLGATFYELLTLRPAVPGADKQAALRQIAFEEPIPPRKLDATIPPELETIALKALAKEPAERYPSAGEFAADLRRWLNHQTIRARRPSLRQRVDKWTRRHSAAILSAAATLLIGTGVSTSLAIKALGAQRRAERAEQRASTEAAIALAVNDFLQTDVLGPSDGVLPFSDDVNEYSDLTVKQALDRAAVQIGQRFQGQPLVEAAIRTSIGQSYHRIKCFTLAVPHLERAVALRTDILGPDHAVTLATAGILATEYTWASRHADATALWQQLLANRRAKLGPDHAETLACQEGLAHAYQFAGQLDASARLYEQLLARNQALQGPHHGDTLDVMSNLAWTYALMDRLPEALTIYDSVLRLQRSPIGSGPIPPNMLRHYAEVSLWAGKLDLSERLAREALQQARRQRQDFLDARIGIGNSCGFLAANLLAQGRFREAEPFAREAVALASADNKHPYWVSVLGAILAGEKRYAEAEPVLLQGYQGLQHVAFRHPALKRRLIEVAGWIARYYDLTKQPEKARRWRENPSPAATTGPGL